MNKDVAEPDDIQIFSQVIERAIKVGKTNKKDKHAEY